MTIDKLRSGLRTLANSGAMPPLVGHELADDRGMVVAEAELAWVQAHFALLTFDQRDLAVVWESGGWKTLVLDEDSTTVNGAIWTYAVGVALGIDNFNKSNKGDSA